MHKTSSILAVAALTVLFASFHPLNAQDVRLRVVGWNLESGDSDPNELARRIANEDSVDIWGLSEVESARVARRMEQAAEDGENANFETIVGTTGGPDRLCIIYDTERLNLERFEELSLINIGGRVRAPLVAYFSGKTTGIPFAFMVNHLYRGDAAGRHTQATLLNEWAKQQSLPVITVGDFNIDWHFQTGDVDHDRSYDNLIKKMASSLGFDPQRSCPPTHPITSQCSTLYLCMVMQQDGNTSRISSQRRMIFLIIAARAVTGRCHPTIGRQCVSGSGSLG